MPMYLNSSSSGTLLNQTTTQKAAVIKKAESCDGLDSAEQTGSSVMFSIDGSADLRTTVTPNGNHGNQQQNHKNHNKLALRIKTRENGQVVIPRSDSLTHSPPLR